MKGRNSYGGKNTHFGVQAVLHFYSKGEALDFIDSLDSMSLPNKALSVKPGAL